MRPRRPTGHKHHTRHISIGCDINAVLTGPLAYAAARLLVTVVAPSPIARQTSGNGESYFDQLVLHRLNPSDLLFVIVVLGV
jgi:hypothetical protein